MSAASGSRNAAAVAAKIGWRRVPEKGHRHRPAFGSFVRILHGIHDLGHVQGGVGRVVRGRGGPVGLRRDLPAQRPGRGHDRQLQRGLGFGHRRRAWPISDFFRCIKTTPGLVMVAGAIIGGPLASTAYVVGLQKAGSIVVPIRPSARPWVPFSANFCSSST